MSNANDEISVLMHVRIEWNVIRQPLHRTRALEKWPVCLEGKEGLIPFPQVKNLCRNKKTKIPLKKLNNNIAWKIFENKGQRQENGRCSSGWA